jgi:acetylornithine deacetylase/succinyl-diaminopimelate desuccinylase-like protein
MEMERPMKTTLAYALANQETHLNELISFLQIPSVSTQPEHDEEVAAAARWLADAMRHAGLENVQLIQTAGHPLVYADWLHAGDEAPTVLIYGHYDVQPAEPFDLWETPPFEPTVRDDYLYARGSSDDKGQAFIHVKAVQAHLAVNGRLPVNVKFIMEGEEESGGASLHAFIPENKELLGADVALVSDTAMISKEQPSIVYGLRGMCYLYLDITGPTRDLHSGSFGGGIDNPLNVLGHIIAKLKNENGRVCIPGFYDDVRELSATERAMLAQYNFDVSSWLAETGAPQAWGDPDYTLVERLGARPTLDVHGIIGGYTGPGGKTVLPSTVHCKLSMRLVPDQDPQKIEEAFKAYIQEIAPPTVKVEVSGGHGAPASITDLNIPAMKAAVTAYTETFGKEPIFMREGGSIPVVGQFQEYLGLETVLMGFGLPDDKIHAPNERFYLPNFFKGIETSIRFLDEFGS